MNNNLPNPMLVGLLLDIENDIKYLKKLTEKLIEINNIEMEENEDE